MSDLANQRRGLKCVTGRFIHHPVSAKQLGLWLKRVAVVDDQIGPGDQTGFFRC
jgi:hypothetical protein